MGMTMNKAEEPTIAFVEQEVTLKAPKSFGTVAIKTALQRVSGLAKPPGVDLEILAVKEDPTDSEYMLITVHAKQMD